MTVLAHQRCRQHPTREAVVRCPVCLRYYCRECVTEHRGRMMCASCLAEIGSSSTSAPGVRSVGLIFSGAGGLLLAWLIFYYLGVALARIPSDFFE